MNPLVKAIKNPLFVGDVLMRHALYKVIKNDRRYVKWFYFFGMGKFPNLKNPVTFNEKLTWFKLNDRDDSHTAMVDKAEAKKLVKEILGSDENIIPTLGVWDNFDDIDFDKLPSQFVLKTTHDSGGVVVCTDKSTFDFESAKKKLEKCLKCDFYSKSREWPYKNVKPRILAEKFMVDESGTELKDYKFFCFNGEPRFLFIATDRPFDTRFDFYDLDFNHMPVKQGHPWATKTINRPDKFEDMIAMARKLSAGMPQVRVDLYNINGKIYFGEWTFCHFSGNVPFKPAEWDKKFGDMWDLSAYSH